MIIKTNSYAIYVKKNIVIIDHFIAILAHIIYVFHAYYKIVLHHILIIMLYIYLILKKKILIEKYYFLDLMLVIKMKYLIS